ncbi:hydroxyisourate hydrolase [Flocculibacter collagenilyticus]|uniref:hydroxyisourate hydrolase n=1 Tax=Flocculibacter collagenilyticus TaxID=2744479 RepID=UPI0018F4CB04|nr:hydroxyisourate hydrolase [Flocculibacter collagenilyticus]
MSQITSHVLDTNHGCPAKGIDVSVYKFHKEGWDKIGSDTTNQDGRTPNLLNEGVTLEGGIYRVHFATLGYFEHLDIPCFYPYVDIVFSIANSDDHYHIPLLLSPFGYTTYRGS